MDNRQTYWLCVALIAAMVAASIAWLIGLGFQDFSSFVGVEAVLWAIGAIVVTYYFYEALGYLRWSALLGIFWPFATLLGCFKL